jgi:hypothetical protein
MAQILHSDGSLDAMHDLSLASNTNAEHLKDMTLHSEEVREPLGFLDLPREIRDQIYDLILVSSKRIYPSKNQATISPCLGILRTNRQIYHETVVILYSENTFQIRGTPGWKSPEFLNLLSCQRRDGYIQAPFRDVARSQVCLARHHLKRLYIPSHGITLDRLKHLFSLLKHFPNLECLEVVYKGGLGVRDMDFVTVCRLLRDRRHLIRDFVLLRRISYAKAEDISWMIREKPYTNWTSMSGNEGKRHTWENQLGTTRMADVVDASQDMSE